MKMQLTYIENHFLENKHWKKYFIANFPEYSTDTWVQDVWSLFERNGYRYEIEMYRGINAVKYITLFDPTGYDVAQMRDLATSDALQQFLIHIICDHIVDFNTFK